MALVSPQIHLSKWLVLMVSIISAISNGHAQTRILVSNKVTNFEKPKGAVKTIESHQTGEVIDCVDIFKQPAFNHPLLKNHTIEMRPSSNQKVNEAGDTLGVLSQPWWKYGECPKGTIPILRPQNFTHRLVASLTPNVKRHNRSVDFLPPLGRHEYAVVALRGGVFKGGQARINLWNPTVMDLEFSIAQIWVAAGPKMWANTVEAGIMVTAIDEPRRVPRFFVYWTSDGYGDTGCYNLNCVGFVQLNHRVALGGQIGPVSTYDGQQYDLSVRIRRNDITKSWWLSVEGTDIGYWPVDLFNFLKCPATRVEWGGEIFNQDAHGTHTSTHMGSGHFPNEGFRKAAFFRNLQFFDAQQVEKDPEDLITTVTNPACYDARQNLDDRSQFGVNFYYGGPGYSDQCQS